MQTLFKEKFSSKFVKAAQLKSLERPQLMDMIEKKIGDQINPKSAFKTEIASEKTLVNKNEKTPDVKIEEPEMNL